MPNKRHIMTVLGARPQFIKATAFSRALREMGSGNVSQTIIHTGQHFHENMSGSFFTELDIPTQFDSFYPLCFFSQSNTWYPMKIRFFLYASRISENYIRRHF